MKKLFMCGAFLLSVFGSVTTQLNATNIDRPLGDPRQLSQFNVNTPTTYLYDVSGGCTIRGKGNSCEYVTQDTYTPQLPKNPNNVVYLFNVITDGATPDVTQNINGQNVPVRIVARKVNAKIDNGSFVFLINAEENRDLKTILEERNPHHKNQPWNQSRSFGEIVEDTVEDAVKMMKNCNIA